MTEKRDQAEQAALFDLFYGDLKTAPMIEQCPVCMQCRLERTVDFSTHDVFVGEIVAAYAQKEVLATDGNIDISKVKLLLLDVSSKKYWSLGKAIGNRWNIGKQLKAGHASNGSAILYHTPAPLRGHEKISSQFWVFRRPPDKARKHWYI
jgi:hypothetical protein